MEKWGALMESMASSFLLGNQLERKGYGEDARVYNIEQALSYMLLLEEVHKNDKVLLSFMTNYNEQVAIKSLRQLVPDTDEQQINKKYQQILTSAKKAI